MVAQKFNNSPRMGHFQSANNDFKIMSKTDKHVMRKREGIPVPSSSQSSHGGLYTSKGLNHQIHNQKFIISMQKKMEEKKSRKMRKKSTQKRIANCNKCLDYGHVSCNINQARLNARTASKQKAKKRTFRKPASKIKRSETKKMSNSKFQNKIEKVIVQYYANQVFKGKNKVFCPCQQVCKVQGLNEIMDTAKRVIKIVNCAKGILMSNGAFEKKDVLKRECKQTKVRTKKKAHQYHRAKKQRPKENY